VLLTPSAQAVPSPAAAAATSAGKSGDSADDQLMFVANAGQFDKNVRFQVSGAGGTLFLTDDALWLSVLDPQSTIGMRRRADMQADRAATAAATQRGVTPRTLRGVNLRLSFVGANPRSRLEPFQRLKTQVSYLHGAKANWHTDVAAWAGVRYRDLYPGIDLEVSGAQGRLQQVLRARPGANLAAVRLRIAGDEAHSIEGDQLRLHTAVGDLALPLLRVEASDGLRLSPTLTPSIDGADISAPFAQTTSETTAATPQATDLIYSTFLGGSYEDQVWSLAIDGSGSAYVTGETFSPDFPAKLGAWDGSCGTDGTGKCNYDATGDFYYTDVFVVKMNAAGTERVYSTFIGGGRGEGGYGIAVDGSGAAYITGYTYSADFPRNNALDSTCGTDGDCDYNSDSGFYYYDGFVVKLSPDGADLAYATYLGGVDDEWGTAIAVDGDGAAYVTGSTYSYDFPTPNGYDQTCGSDGACNFDATNSLYPADGFAAKISADGSSLDYGTFLGGGWFDYSYGIAVGQNGSAYITGITVSTDFPFTSNAYDQDCGTDGTCNNDGQYVYYDTFVVKLLPDGTDREYATYLGGSNLDYGKGIVVDNTGAAYIAGYTFSATGFPVSSNAYDKTFNGATDAFVAKLNATGTAVSYATYLGGSNTDYATSIGIDSASNAYVGGGTFSSNFPTTLNAYDPLFNGAEDAFMAKLNSTGTALPYSTFLGGTDIDEGYGIAVSGGNVYVGGLTSSANFPVSETAYDKSYAGNTCGADPDSHSCYDTFVLKLVPTTSTTPRLTRTFLPIVKAQVPPLCDTLEPNDDRKTNPRQILIGTTYRARLCRGDQDNYYFDITRNVQATIRLDLSSTTLRTKPILLYLYAQTDLGGTLCTNGSPPSVTTCGVLLPGRYIVRLYAENRDLDYDNQGFYSLLVTTS
jgi:hypothetical protein